MCELMTIAAALAFTALHFLGGRAGRASRAVATTALMFWGAALMWGVDCVHGALEDGQAFDLSAHDARLGAIVLAAGLAVFAGLSLRERLRGGGAR